MTIARGADPASRTRFSPGKSAGQRAEGQTSGVEPFGVRLGRFIWERFPLAAYGPLIAAFISCGWIAAGRAHGEPPSIGIAGLVAAGVVTLVFFRQRLADEVKDAEIDRVARPGRPIPRGLVSATELERAYVACVVIECALAASLGIPALIAYGVVLAFSLLSARDFLVETALGHPLAYALAHAPIIALLTVFVWAAHPAAGWSPSLLSVALLGTVAAFALEIGRKTFAPAEERPLVASYSASLGRAGAIIVGVVALVTGIVAAGTYVVLAGGPPEAAEILTVAVGSTLVIGSAAIRMRWGLAWRGYVDALALGLLCWPAALEIMRGSSW